MTGDDVKRQVMEGVEMLCGTSDEAETEVELHFRELLTALAPCVVLTREEAAFVAKLLDDVGTTSEEQDIRAERALALLSDPGDLPHDPPLNEDGC